MSANGASQNSTYFLGRCIQTANMPLMNVDLFIECTSRSAFFVLGMQVAIELRAINHKGVERVLNTLIS